MTIFLIRHGETTGDIEDRYGGAYDDRLTEQGRAQLAETATRLLGKTIDRMYVSTLTRARESADIILETIPTPVEYLDGLRERDYGVLGGLTKAEVLANYPEAVELHKDPANTDPEGESQADFIKRVVDTFETIRHSGHESVAIVAHGGPIKVILTHLGEPLPERIGDGEIIEVEV